MAEQEPVDLGAPVRSFGLNAASEGRWGGQALLTAALLLVATTFAAAGWYIAAGVGFVLSGLATWWCFRQIGRDMRTTVLTIYEHGFVYDEGGRRTHTVRFLDISQAWTEQLKYGPLPTAWDRVLYLVVTDGQEIRIDRRVGNHVRAEGLIEARLAAGTLRKPDSSPTP